jgi:hypothetical protein
MKAQNNPQSSGDGDLLLHAVKSIEDAAVTAWAAEGVARIERYLAFRTAYASYRRGLTS